MPGSSPGMSQEWFEATAGRGATQQPEGDFIPFLNVSGRVCNPAQAEMHGTPGQKPALTSETTLLPAP